MTALPAVVAMIHLLPLPGSPRFDGSIDRVLEDAVRRATTLTEAGFKALMVENFGDVPFYPDSVPAHTVAALTRAVVEVERATRGRESVPAIGINILRNDARAAIDVASATGAEFVRVNVLTGSMDTDQGPIVGRAAEVVRARAILAPATRIWADVFAKHAVAPPGLTLEQAALDTWERGGADALIVSGPATGQSTDPERLRRLRRAVPAAPLVVGSGCDADNLAEFAELADHVIVGTALEAEGRPGAALDPARVDAFAAAAARVGLA